MKKLHIHRGIQCHLQQKNSGSTCKPCSPVLEALHPPCCERGTNTPWPVLALLLFFIHALYCRSLPYMSNNFLKNFLYKLLMLALWVKKAQEILQGPSMTNLSSSPRCKCVQIVLSHPTLLKQKKKIKKKGKHPHLPTLKTKTSSRAA